MGTRLIILLLCAGIGAQGQVQAQQMLVAPKPLPENVRLSCVIHSGLLTCDIPVVADGAETVKKWPCPLDPLSLCQDAPQPQFDSHANSLAVNLDGKCVNSDGKWLSCVPEPIDVPAIQHKRKYPARDNGNVCNDGDTLMMAGPGVFTQYDHCEELHWTCADALRVLEHDESTPPHYTCRRVEK